jgi:hypothetical protein
MMKRELERSGCDFRREIYGQLPGVDVHPEFFIWRGADPDTMFELRNVL